MIQLNTIAEAFDLTIEKVIKKGHPGYNTHKYRYRMDELLTAVITNDIQNDIAIKDKNYKCYICKSFST